MGGAKHPRLTREKWGAMILYVEKLKLYSYIDGELIEPAKGIRRGNRVKCLKKEEECLKKKEKGAGSSV